MTDQLMRCLKRYQQQGVLNNIIVKHGMVAIVKYSATVCLSILLNFVHRLWLPILLWVMSPVPLPVMTSGGTTSSHDFRYHFQSYIDKVGSGHNSINMIHDYTQNPTSSSWLQSLLLLNRFCTIKKREKIKYICLISSSNNT